MPSSLTIALGAWAMFTAWVGCCLVRDYRNHKRWLREWEDADLLKALREYYEEPDVFASERDDIRSLPEIYR